MSLPGVPWKGKPGDETSGTRPECVLVQLEMGFRLMALSFYRSYGHFAASHAATSLFRLSCQCPGRAFQSCSSA
jgi:hypothetical protein